jgi:DinB superfamily
LLRIWYRFAVFILGPEIIFILVGKRPEDSEVVIQASIKRGGFNLEQTIFHHMETVRGITEQTIKRIPEEVSDLIPEGFNNNIRWNFGHIAYVQEKLVVGILGEEMNIPKDYERLFSAGTKPAEWNETPPSLTEIAMILTEQKTRIKGFLPGRLHEKLPTPFTNRAGITFYTAGEAFLFSFYHEALHIETIKRLYRSISSL